MNSLYTSAGLIRGIVIRLLLPFLMCVALLAASAPSNAQSGCTSPSACNFDPFAITDDGSCTWTTDCAGNCGGNFQLDDCGNCFDLQMGTPLCIPGCTDPQADNYEPTATNDDGSCLFELGCIDPSACNFDPLAISEDGSCVYVVDCAGVCGGNFIQDLCGNCYDPNNLNNDPDYFAFTGAIQYYTVPNGVYTIHIEAAGAQGGNSSYGTGGLGAIVNGDISVTPGEQLSILVGGQGFGTGEGAGGGGGSFVIRTGNTPLIIAGGGGGAGGYQETVPGDYQDGKPGIAAESGTNSQPSFNQYFIADGLGGANGNGGTGGQSHRPGGGGGGFLSDGGEYLGCHGGCGNGYGGDAFVNGGAGGAGENNDANRRGGFGGGGGAALGGGGGSGYSGGGGGTWSGYTQADWGHGGGGGGSFNSGLNPEGTDGANAGNGYVTISYSIVPECDPGCTDPSACNFNPEAEANDGSCFYPDGCTDLLACNYNPLALCDDASCVYGGCDDAAACNYNPGASCNDGSCIYEVDCAGNCGGNFILDACGNCYDPLNPGNAESVQISFTGSLQTYTIPEGVYAISIEVSGAQGGNSSYGTGGLGARMSGSFTVVPGEVLSILVGGQGNGDSDGAGGGGGTYIVRSGNIPLIIAGGGGGAGGYQETVPGDYQDGKPGVSSTNGTNSQPSFNQYFIADGLGGTNGNGGTGGQSHRPGGGGGGFFSDGGEYLGCHGGCGNGFGGDSYLNGGAGGAGEDNNINQRGGYGGGGGSALGGGGGGGYSGGGGGTWSGYTQADWGHGGGGGGSYNAGDNQVNSDGVQMGNGVAIITYFLAPECNAGCMDPNACNFDANADVDDSSCIYPDGCTDAMACNYDPQAECNDNSCVYPGCNDMLACNFDPNAGCDNGTCVYFVDCSGVCGGNYILDACGNCYDPNQANEGNQQFNFTGAMQHYTVPEGVYTLHIEVAGAQGGNSSYGTGGLGAIVNGDISVTPGEQLSILIGGQGSGTSDGAGGGGGTFVVRSGNIPLIIAGGGGGAGGYAETIPGDYQDGKPGVVAESGTNSQPSFNQYFIADGLGGANGNGGTGGQSHRPGGGGGGFLSDGGEYLGCHGGCGNGYGGDAFVNGGAGGAGENNDANRRGGFGGGGGAALGGGGGGGYSGGGGGTWSGYTQADWGHGGGGGGSYNSGLNPAGTDGANASNGYVFISYNSIPVCNSGCMDPAACNFDPLAEVEDNSCIYPDGCTDILACNYVPAAQCDNGSCTYPGCDDAAACNYDPGASCNDGSCIYEVDCAGNCGGNFILDACGNCYDPLSPGNAESVQFSFTGSLQTYTIPEGVYAISIEVSGAQGGNSSYGTGGLGARMSGSFTVVPGEVLSILVGGQGNGDSDGAGGGGGTYIVRSGNIPLIIAGGGGGAGGYQETVPGDYQDGKPGVSSTSGTNSQPSFNQYFIADGLGGSNGNGGTGGQSHRPGGGGGGFLSDGGEYLGCHGGCGNGFGGDSYLNGGAGGAGEDNNINQRGGYGGGGGSALGGGGGGGYSGGGGGTWSGYTQADWGHGGGGGGSYNAGDNQVNSDGVQSGNGVAIITYFLAPECNAGCMDPNACNFDANADVDDSSCIYPNGCTDAMACNYDPLAQCNDNSCVYPGCDDMLACNFDPNAGCDNGTCVYYIDCAGVCGGNYILDACGNCYNPENVGSGPVQFEFNGSVQYMTIPEGVTQVTIEAAGAQGGNSSYGVGGLGARLTGSFAVVPGEQLSVVVGGQGAGTSEGAGGGGGSFVVRSGNIPLLIAGGGGGAGGYAETIPGDFQDGKPGVVAESGTNSQPSFNQYFIADGLGGTNGNGGTGGQSHRPGGGGGGFLSDGGEYLGCHGGCGNGFGGDAFVNGGAGGAGENNDANRRGGFGGGGGAALGGGGGGGYSGGGGGTWSGYSQADWGHGGGGGGSYNAGSEPVGNDGVQSGNGYVIFYFEEIPECNAGCMDPIACNYNALADVDDGSCIYPDGCVDPLACNFGPEALCDDGSCVYPGCNDVSACNFDPAAACDDGSCIYLIDCQGTCGGSFVLDDCGNCYDPGQVGDQVQFGFTGNIQYYTVPEGVTSLRMEAFGAQGGNSTYGTGGLGASMSGTFDVVPGEVLSIAVGGQGYGDSDGAGGGGGTYVVRSGNIPLLVAGGGGGAGGYQETVPGDYQDGKPGVASENGSNSQPSFNQYFLADGLGGSNGNGGTGGESHRPGGGGGGFYTDGGEFTQGYGGGNYGRGGDSFLNGGTGGLGEDNAVNQRGGYGGGGGSALGGGGGGGYSGGGGGTWSGYTQADWGHGGGGGGSFNSGSDQYNLEGVNIGNGLVNIYFNQIPDCSPGCTDPFAINYDPNANFDNSSCLYSGCTDPSACNFDPQANENDGSCEYIIDCAGNCGGNFVSDECGNCYDADNVVSLSFFYTGSLQSWCVPMNVSEIHIEAYGAQGGGANGSSGGLGAYMSGDFLLNPGTVLKVLVGGQGESGDGLYNYSGGGGGSFVTESNNSPLIVAGGGGGTNGLPTNGSEHGSTGSSGNDGYSPNSPQNYGIGGSNGSGAGNVLGGYACAGNGGGLLTSGEEPLCAIPGIATSGESFAYGGEGGISACGGGISGGFGGGGGGGCHGAGGGGGYSGGGGNYHFGGNGGGGGSFNAGLNQNNSAGANQGNGYIIISYIDAPACVPGCTDPLSDNYNPEATYDNGTCSNSGCMDPLAANYDPNATSEDGSCFYPGCTYANASNYNPQANQDDGSCLFPGFPGCMDPLACNYNAAVTIDDGSCYYPILHYDCFGACISDSDFDGVCDDLEIAGCQDPQACNYNPNATDDDGCNWDCYGCTYLDADNYNPAATEDDGSCLFTLSNCGPGTYWDAFYQACMPEADPCPQDINGDGTINTSDLLDLLAVFGTNCQ